MAPLNPEASPFIPSATVSPLVATASPISASGTPLVFSASPFFPSSALSPASQQVLAGELAALDRREARHARRESEQQQQQWGDGRMQMAQLPVYMYQPQTFGEVPNYQQQQGQYQTQYQMQYQQQYQPYEQNWISCQHRIEAQQPQHHHEIRGPTNQGFVGNQPEPQHRNQTYVGTQHPPQSYTPPTQHSQPLRQLWDGSMETTIYPAPPPPVPRPSAQPPSMNKKHMRQMDGHTPMNETGMQMMQAYNPEDVVQVRQPDNTNKRMTVAQYAASKGQQPVYVPHFPSEYQQYQQPVYVQTQVYPQAVVVQGVASQQQQPYEQNGARQRAVSSQLPIYVHKRELGAVPGYEGYLISPQRKVVRPDRVFAEVEESPVPAGGPRVRLPRAESSPAHLRDHNGGIARFNSDLTPTRRRTDDGRNNGNCNNEGYNLANELQQYHQRQHSTIRGASGNANDGGYHQHQREFYNSNGRNANQSRELEEVEEEERVVRAIRRESRDRKPDRSHYSARNILRRQQEPAEALPLTNTTAAPTLSSDNFLEGTTAVTSSPSATKVNTTMTSPRRVAPTPTRRPTVEDLSFAPAATSPVRTYNFPYAPTTSSGQPLNLPGPRTNSLSSISDRVACGEIVPADTMDPHNLATQSVVSQMEANARAAAAGGRGEITYMDRGKYWVERKKAGKNAWEMEGWKVGGGGAERPENSSEEGPNEGKKQDNKQKNGGYVGEAKERDQGADKEGGEDDKEVRGQWEKGREGGTGGEDEENGEDKGDKEDKAEEW